MIRNPENRPASWGVWYALASSASVVRASSASPSPARSSSSSLKPPTVPSPCTGGGGNTATNASWMDANFWFSAPAMLSPYSAFDRRSSNGLSGKKTIPALGELTNPLIERPGNCTAFATPGCCNPMSDIRLSTASVRSSAAPSGSCANATRYCLSWVGTKPAGTFTKPTAVSTSSPAYTARAGPLVRITRATTAP